MLWTLFPFKSRIKPLHTHTKTKKTAVRPVKFDEHSGDVVKLLKYLVFTFIHVLRGFYAAVRFSLILGSYYALIMSNKLLPCSRYVKEDRTTRLSCSHCFQSVLTNTMTRAVLPAAGYIYQTQAFFQPKAKNVPSKIRRVCLYSVFAFFLPLKGATCASSRTCGP